MCGGGGGGGQMTGALPGDFQVFKICGKCVKNLTKLPSDHAACELAVYPSVFYSVATVVGWFVCRMCVHSEQ